MDSSQQQVSNWLEALSHKKILINKQEDGDVDEIQLQLQKVNVAKLKEEDPDEYVALQTLLLHGQGTIKSGEQEASLPQDVYEIPFTDQWAVHDHGGSMEIRTERAVYTIQPLQ